MLLVYKVRLGPPIDESYFSPHSMIADEADVNHFTSAGGLWNYTIGLVGKPSAGKSSFYNAATCAAFSRDGRRMAAVAAHPFTTIEPNIGPGFFPGPADNNSGKSLNSLCKNVNMLSCFKYFRVASRHFVW